MLLTFNFTDNFNGIEPSISFKFSYIPDREIITEDSLNKWLEQLKQQNWQTPEELCGYIVKLFYDAALPYKIKLKANTKHSNGIKHNIKHVKHQPDFEG